MNRVGGPATVMGAARRLLLLAAAAFLSVPALAAEPVVYFVGITINGVERDGFHAALERDGAFALEDTAYSALGLKVPDTPAESLHGRRFLPLQAAEGLSYSFDGPTLSLTVTCTPACFPPGSVSGEWQPVPADPTAFGLYLNYDLIAEKNGSADFAGAVAELGLFSRHGHGEAGFTTRYRDGATDLIRLETSWTIDRPDRRRRWRFGDSITVAGGWGRAARFGGIQYGTDFSLQPGFVTFPTPAIRGEASLPSTVDIYVNGVQRATVDLDPGPFTIEQPPVITGAGDLRVVVHDLLGRETVLIQPFYASRSLLRDGLSDYSLEAGALRQGYGLESFDYATAFAAGSYRRGLSDRLTAGFHAELTENHAGLGPSLDWQLPFGGVLSAAAAASLQGGRTGFLAQAELNWSSERFGLHVAEELASAGFVRLGTPADRHEARMRTSANAGFDLKKFGAVSLNYTRIDERDSDDFEILSANYSRQVGRLGTFGVNLARSFGAFADTAIYVSFTARLGARTSGSASFDHGGATSTGTVRASRSAPAEGGWAYRAEASRDDGTRGRAGATYDSAKGSVSLDLSAANGTEAARFGARGGLVLIGGNLFATRFVDDSFALVQVGDFEGVTVMKENRRVARTNRRGRALITGLRAYEENRLSIDPLDLPLSAEIGAAAMIRVPRRHSGVIADFPVGRVRAALARIVDARGQPLPPGTLLHALDGGSDFPVGFGGQAYMMGADHRIRFEARTAAGRCVVTVPPVDAAPVPVQLGILTCEGDKP